MSLELLNPSTPEGAELGYLLIRLATAHAEKSSNPAALRRSLERRIASIVKRSSVQDDPEHNRAPERAPMTAEEAKLRTQLLKSSLQ
jgi:hypothetical protein